MSLLIFHKNGQELMRYVLRRESSSIGRGVHSDICLPDSNISRTHFVITSKDGAFWLTDKSTNGTIVNGKTILSQELKSGDRIQVGDWMIQFTLQDLEQAPSAATEQEQRDPTEVISYNVQQNELKLRKACLESVDGKNTKRMTIHKEIVAIGKAKSNDICLAEDDFVSNFHCKIEFRRGRFFLKDLQSTNGTFLNKQQVIDVSLPSGSVITVGKTDLKFYLQEEVEKISPHSKHQFQGMLGGSSRMRELYTVLERVAKSDATILLQGETGTGKELVAKAIHDLSGRSAKKLVTINCTAIAKDLIESELFGHEKGAFTSAYQQRKGAFEEAQGGTLLLDEIGDMPMELQPKLLRVLENREIKRVGSSTLIDIDVRLIAATHQDLATMVKKGQFREDLYYRLYVVPVALPPLRERLEDILILAQHFLEDARGKQPKPKGFSAAAKEAMLQFAWPGNVRELKNVIHRAVLSCSEDEIDAKHLHFSPEPLKERTLFDPKAAAASSREAPAPSTKTLKDFEREKILQELIKNNWNKKKTAEVLGIAKTTLFEKIKKYQLKP